MSTLKHFKQSVLPDGANTQLIQPSDWNHDHVLDPAVTGVLVDVNGTNAIVGVAASTENTYLRRKITGGAVAYEFSALPLLYALDYQFTRTPSGNLLAAAGQVMTLTSLPAGVSSTYSPLKHYIRIIDPIAGNETCLIKTVSGNTITIDCTIAHTSGNYTITSATMGIQEAHYTPSLTVQCYGPAGITWQIWQTIFLHGGTTLNFNNSTPIFRMFNNANPLIKIEGTRPGSEWGGGIFNIFTGYSGVPSANANGYMIEVNDTANTFFENIYGRTIGSGIWMNNATNITLNGLKLEFFSGIGVRSDGATTFTCNQYMGRTNENGAIFYLPGAFGSSGQFNTFMWQGGPIACPDTRGIIARAGMSFSESSFVNGIVDSMPIFLEYNPGAVTSYNIRISNIGYFGGQTSQTGNVTTSGTAVTWVSGVQFTGLRPGNRMTIGGITYEIASIATATTVTLSTSAGNQTNVPASYSIIAVFASIGNTVQNLSVDNVDIYGAGHTNGIVVFNGGSNITFNGVRIHGTVPSANGNRGFQIGGLVKDLTIKNCSVGYDALGLDPNMALGIVIENFAHERILIDGCKIAGTVNALATAGSNSWLRLGYNIGIDDLFVSIVAAATITISPNSVQAVSGTAIIATILGGWPGRKVTFIFSDVAPGGFATSGNIIGNHPVAPNVAVTLMFINNGWY